MVNRAPQGLALKSGRYMPIDTQVLQQKFVLSANRKEHKNGAFMCYLRKCACEKPLSLIKILYLTSGQAKKPSQN